MKFWKLIELLCEERGVTPQIMAMRIGVKQCTVESWKYKGKLPKWETQVRLCEYFHVSRAYFLDFEAEHFSK